MPKVHPASLLRTCSRLAKEKGASVFQLAAKKMFTLWSKPSGIRRKVAVSVSGTCLKVVPDQGSPQQGHRVNLRIPLTRYRSADGFIQDFCSVWWLDLTFASLINYSKSLLFSWSCLRNRSNNWTITRWWFQILFIFTPIPGEDFQFDEHIFQMGWFNHHLVISWLPWLCISSSFPGYMMFEYGAWLCLVAQKLRLQRYDKFGTFVSSKIIPFWSLIMFFYLFWSILE